MPHAAAHALQHSPPSAQFRTRGSARFSILPQNKQKWSILAVFIMHPLSFQLLKRVTLDLMANVYNIALLYYWPSQRLFLVLGVSAH